MRKSTMSDYIPAKPTTVPENSTSEDESPPMTPNGGSKLFPAASVLEELSNKTLKELGEYLKDTGLTAAEIKEGFPKRLERFKEVAMLVAEQRSEWQEEAPEGWPVEE